MLLEIECKAKCFLWDKKLIERDNSTTKMLHKFPLKRIIALYLLRFKYIIQCSRVTKICILSCDHTILLINCAHLNMLNLYNEFFQIWSLRKLKTQCCPATKQIVFYNQLEFVFSLKPLLHVSRRLNLKSKCRLFKKEAWWLVLNAKCIYIECKSTFVWLLLCEKDKKDSETE